MIANSNIKVCTTILALALCGSVLAANKSRYKEYHPRDKHYRHSSHHSCCCCEEDYWYRETKVVKFPIYKGKRRSKRRRRRR